MRKRTLTMLVVLALTTIYSNIYGQTYHKSDKEGLRQLLRQNGNLKTVKLIPEDTLLWHVSEDWIRKIEAENPYATITWNNQSPKRIIKINFSWSTHWMSGHLDCRPFEGLQEINCSENNFETINITNNANLTKVNISNNEISMLDVSNNPMLIQLNCSENQIHQLNISQNPQLKELICNNTSLNNLNTSQNPNLQQLVVDKKLKANLNTANNPKINISTPPHIQQYNIQ